MRIDPYTTASTAYHKKEQRLANLVSRAYLETQGLDDPTFMYPEFEGYTFTEIMGVYPSDTSDDLPELTQPCIVNVLKNPMVFADMRPFVTDSRATKKACAVRNFSDFNLMLFRTVLTSECLHHERALDSLATRTSKFFERFITSTIITKLNLRNDFTTQTQISILCHIYYLTLFDEDTDGDMDREYLKTWLCRNLPFSFNDVEYVVDNAQPMRCFNDFCTNLEVVTQNPRLKSITGQVLYTMLSGSWFGVNAREIIGVALEHAPTFIALVYSSLTDRSFRKAVLAQRINDFGDRNYRTAAEESIRRVIFAHADKA